MRPLPRNRRSRPTASSNPHVPLSRLRRRFAFGAGTGAAVFAVALLVAILRGAGGSDAAIVGIEVGASAATVLCAVIATMTWIITEHVAYLASLWSMIESIQSAGPDGGSGHLTLASEERRSDLPAGGANPIPIQHGRDMKQQREGRNAV